MSNNPYHPRASAFADDALRRLGMTDPWSQEDGRAEFTWDLAYDAFMWRIAPSLPALGGGASSDLDLIPGGKL